MTDSARRIAKTSDATFGAAMTNLFVLLERANWLIFWDAWHHVGAYLAGDWEAIAAPRVVPFMRQRRGGARMRAATTSARWCSTSCRTSNI